VPTRQLDEDPAPPLGEWWEAFDRNHEDCTPAVWFEGCPMPSWWEDFLGVLTGVDPVDSIARVANCRWLDDDEGLAWTLRRRPPVPVWPPWMFSRSARRLLSDADPTLRELRLLGADTVAVVVCVLKLRFAVGHPDYWQAGQAYQAAADALRAGTGWHPGFDNLRERMRRLAKAAGGDLPEDGVVCGFRYDKVAGRMVSVLEELAEGCLATARTLDQAPRPGRKSRENESVGLCAALLAHHLKSRGLAWGRWPRVYQLLKAAWADKLDRDADDLAFETGDIARKRAERSWLHKRHGRDSEKMEMWWRLHTR